MLEVSPGINDTNATKTSTLAGELDRLIRAFDNVGANGVPLMVDIASCYRWQALCKGKLWARADQAVTHIGLHRFAAAYSDAGSGGQRITVVTNAPAKPYAGKAGNGVKEKPGGW